MRRRPCRRPVISLCNIVLHLLVRHTALLRRLSSHSAHSTHFPFSNRFLEVPQNKKSAFHCAPDMFGSGQNKTHIRNTDAQGSSSAIWHMTVHIISQQIIFAQFICSSPFPSIHILHINLICFIGVMLL